MTHHHHDAQPADSAREAGLAELLDLDAEVFDSYWTQALAWVQQAATDARRILDLGAGTGTGAIALAQRFPDAEVLAVDASAEMLRRIRDKAADLGLAERVRTVEADLDLGWPVPGPLDVTWASMSLHHLAEPDGVLRDIFAATRPGGLLAVAEFTDQPRFLPDELGLGRPGLEARCLALLQAEHAHSLPELGADWPPRLAAAGFGLVGERTYTLAADPSRPSATVAYARGWLGRLRTGLADRLAAEDAETLDVLLADEGPHSLGRRADLQASGTRTVLLARRP
jgi:SAM-dependent methyltransferase